MNRVCIMTSVHPHDDVRIYHRQAQSLRGAGYEVMILCSDFEGERDGVSFLRIPLPRQRLRRMRRAGRLFYDMAMRQHCDCYQIHDPELLPVALRLRRAGLRVIYDAHEDLPLQLQDKHWIPRLLRPAAAWMAGRYETWAATRLTACIAATPEIAARLGGVAIRNYPFSHELERPFVPFDRRPCQAVYVGGITRNRGMLSMIEAIARTDGVLELAGRLEQMEDFQKLCAMSGMGRVHYRGVLGREDIADLLAQSRMGLLLLHPTAAYRRALPIKLFEYMLAGLPVVASDFPLWRELAGEECALYVDPLDPAAAAQAIQSLLDDPDRARAMGQAGRELALRRYCYETEQQTFLSLYQTLLSPEVRR